MKKIKIIFALHFIFTASVGFSQSIKWLSFEQAVELNKKNPKKFIIDIYTDWCGWCKKMEATTYTNPVIIDYINTYYYAVKLNAERKDTVIFQGHTFVNENKNGSHSTHQLAESLLNGKMSYPTTVFMNEKYQLLTPVAGYLTQEDLEPILSFFALDKYLNTTYDQFKASFVSKIAQPQTAPIISK